MMKWYDWCSMRAAETFLFFFGFVAHVSHVRLVTASLLVRSRALPWPGDAKRKDYFSIGVAKDSAGIFWFWILDKLLWKRKECLLADITAYYMLFYRM